MDADKLREANEKRLNAIVERLSRSDNYLMSDGQFLIETVRSLSEQNRRQAEVIRRTAKLAKEYLTETGYCKFCNRCPLGMVIEHIEALDAARGV